MTQCILLVTVIHLKAHDQVMITTLQNSTILTWQECEKNEHDYPLKFLRL